MDKRVIVLRSVLASLCSQYARTWQNLHFATILKQLLYLFYRD
jgi:hypothetical protein